MYNPENENRIFDDDIAKTIFYARSDMILRGRPVQVALDEIERGITPVIESTLMIIKNDVGKRVYWNYSTEDGLKILQSKIERGEFSADRSLELYGGILCGKCLHEMMEARREEEEKQEA